MLGLCSQPALSRAARVRAVVAWDSRAGVRGGDVQRLRSRVLLRAGLGRMFGMSARDRPRGWRDVRAVSTGNVRRRRRGVHGVPGELHYLERWRAGGGGVYLRCGQVLIDGGRAVLGLPAARGVSGRARRAWAECYTFP